MSVHVMALCYRARFGDPNMKAVALALADNADDDGEKIWPSVPTLAKKTEVSPRTVQYKLRALEEIKLITRVEKDGHKPDGIPSNEYKFNLQLLQDLASGTAKIVHVKGAKSAPPPGAKSAPLAVLGVQILQDRGATAAPKPSLNHQEDARARARELGSSLARSARKEKTPAIRLMPGDFSWKDWLAHLRANDRETLADSAEAAGEMWVDKRWPVHSTHWPHVPKPKVNGYRNPAGPDA